MNWHESAAAVRWDIRPHIGGAHRASSATEAFDNINPATEGVLCRVPVGSAADVDEAVRVARTRFEDGCWSDLLPSRRGEVLTRLADLIVRHRKEIALLDALEMGKPIRSALHDADTFCPTILRSCAGLADKLLGSSAPLNATSLALNTWQPRGVVAAITPWNFPSVNAVIKFAPALAAGNTVVLKPSELSPSSALRIAELALEAGLPEGVLNVVPGLGATVGAALALHPDVDLISFTGSTATGRRIMELSGRSNGKPLLLECGGKSPQVVFSDVDNLESVADATVQSVLWNQGQVCSAHTRLIAHRDVCDVLVDAVIRRMRPSQPGDPLEESTTFGPLASPAQRDRVKRFITQGLQEGAEAILKGSVRESGGCYVSPTVFGRVEPHMSIAREEIFGPVLCVQTFSTDEEALSLANATEYGLSATVWTRDLGRAKRLAHGIKAGSVSVRTSGRESSSGAYVLSHEPQKASGFGAELGLQGLQAYSTLKLVSYNGA